MPAVTTWVLLLCVVMGKPKYSVRWSPLQGLQVCRRFHWILRIYTQSFEDCALGHHDDIYKRPDLVSIPRGSKGFKRSIDPETQIMGHIWSWLQIKGRTFRWSWLSRGLGNREKMAEWHGLTSAQIEAEYDEEQARALDPCSLDALPTVAPPISDDRLAAPLDGEIVRTWAVCKHDLHDVGPDEIPDDAEWEYLPKYLTLLVEKYITKYNHEVAVLGKKVEELNSNPEPSETAMRAAAEKLDKCISDSMFSVVINKTTGVR